MPSEQCCSRSTSADGEVQARVTDSGSWKTPAANPGNSGRGLVLMRVLSDTMEIDSTPTGTTVDITFRLPAATGAVDQLTVRRQRPFAGPGFVVSTGVTRASITIEPALPAAHGPLSTAVRRALTGPPSHDHLARIGASVRDSDPYGLDLQLALCMCYELHYRGFAGVDPTWEWNPALLQLRAELERAFLAGVRRDVGPIEPDQHVGSRNGSDFHRTR